MKFGIVYKEENQKAKQLAFTINAFLKKEEHEVLPEAKFSTADFILILGGDGTFINAPGEFATYHWGKISGIV